MTTKRKTAVSPAKSAKVKEDTREDLEKAFEYLSEEINNADLPGADHFKIAAVQKLEEVRKYIESALTVNDPPK